MFDLGWTELLIIGVVALIVVGPKDLPKMFRTLGQFTAKARNMAREFQRAMDSAADEAGVKDIARDLRDTASGRNIKDAMGFDELDKEMRSMGRPDQWGKSPSQKPAKPGPKAKPDPAAAPPDADEAVVQQDDRDQAARAAHAAAAPHLGRSALDAVELMSVGVNYLREHAPQDARIHYAYLDAGGRAPNVVQARSSVPRRMAGTSSSSVSARTRLMWSTRRMALFTTIPPIMMTPM